MVKPIFAKGKNLDRALAQPEPAGARSLHVANPSDFSVADQVFVSEADGSELEYLGPATAVGSQTVTVTWGLALAKSATARIWRAEAFFQWESVASAPLERAFHEGIVAELSVGGAVWSVRVADPVREDRVRFAGVSRAQFSAFRAWLGAHARGGLDDFTWVDEERAVATVRLLTCDFVQREEIPRALELQIRLAVTREGGYA